MFMHEEEDDDSMVLELIQKLMDELSSKMEYNADDFEKRLGRKKPEVEVSVMKGEMPAPEMELEEDEEEGMEGMGGMSEGDSLKDRLMRLRKG